MCRLNNIIVTVGCTTSPVIEYNIYEPWHITIISFSLLQFQCVVKTGDEKNW